MEQHFRLNSHFTEMDNKNYLEYDLTNSMNSYWSSSSSKAFAARFTTKLRIVFSMVTVAPMAETERTLFNFRVLESFLSHHEAVFWGAYMLNLNERSEDVIIPS